MKNNFSTIKKSKLITRKEIEEKVQKHLSVDRYNEERINQCSSSFQNISEEIFLSNTVHPTQNKKATQPNNIKPKAGLHLPQKQKKNSKTVVKEAIHLAITKLEEKYNKMGKYKVMDLAKQIDELKDISWPKKKPTLKSIKRYLGGWDNIISILGRKPDFSYQKKP